MMSRHVTALLLVGGICALGTAVAWAAGEEENNEEQTGFWVESKTVDVGKILAGTDAVGTFVFHNTTEKAVKIIRAKPS